MIGFLLSGIACASTRVDVMSAFCGLASVNEYSGGGVTSCRGVDSVRRKGRAKSGEDFVKIEYEMSR